MSTPDFQMMRDQWALKAVISKERVQAQSMMDHQANPHNEPYHNKKPVRSEAEIISDLAYTFADGVLLKQYGFEYTDWLRAEGYHDSWGTTVGKKAG